MVFNYFWFDKKGSFLLKCTHACGLGFVLLFGENPLAVA